MVLKVNLEINDLFQDLLTYAELSYLDQVNARMGKIGVII